MRITTTTTVHSRERVLLEQQSALSATSCTIIGSQSRLSRKPYCKQDSCWSWVVCFCCAVSNIILLGFSYSYGVLFPVLLAYFKQDRATTAWVGSLFLSISSLLGPVSSNLCDRYGCKIIAICGALVCILGHLLTSQATTIYTMYLTLSIVVGFGSCCVYTACFVIVPRMFNRRRSLAIAIISLGPAAGIMIMAPVLQSLSDSLGWRNTFLVMAGITSVICLLCCSFDSNTIQDIEDNEETMNAENGFDFSLFRNSEFVKIQIATLVIFLGVTNVQIFLVAYCNKLNINASKASILYFYMGLLSAFSRVMTGHICDLPMVNSKYVLVFGSSLAGTSVIILPFASSYNHLIMFTVAYGIFEGTIGLTLIVTLHETVVHDKQRSCALGVWLTSCAISIAAAPPFIGALVDKFGSYSPGFYLSGSFMIIGCLIPLLRTNQYRSEPDSGHDSGSTSTVETYLDEKAVIIEKLSVV